MKSNFYKKKMLVNAMLQFRPPTAKYFQTAPNICDTEKFFMS